MIGRTLFSCFGFALVLVVQSGTVLAEGQSSEPVSSLVSDWSREEGVAMVSDAEAQIVEEIERGVLRLKEVGSYSDTEIRNALPAATRKYLTLLLQDGEAPEFDAVLVEEISPGGAFFLWPTRWPVIEISTDAQSPEVFINGNVLALTLSQRQKRPLTVFGKIGALIVELRASAVLVCKEEFDAEEGERYSMNC